MQGVTRNAQRLWGKLWSLFRVSYKCAEGCFIPKEKDAKIMWQFWTTSLLNVEGKIYLSVLAKCQRGY
jgi:hypothetical protein